MSVIRAAKRVARNFLGPRDKVHRTFWRCVKHRAGLEIGGPSDAFGDAGILPLYRYIRKLDNCVFSAETIWEGQRLESQTFTYHPKKPMGFNFIRESTDLQRIKNSGYDFILASHALEHTSNPIKALKGMDSSREARGSPNSYPSSLYVYIRPSPPADAG